MGYWAVIGTLTITVLPHVLNDLDVTQWKLHVTHHGPWYGLHIVTTWLDVKDLLILILKRPVTALWTRFEIGQCGFSLIGKF